MNLPVIVKGHKPANTLAWIVILCIGFMIAYPGLSYLSTIQPGFEGAKVHFYGAEFRFNTEWSGTYELHRYQDATDPLILNQQYALAGNLAKEDRIYWGNVGTPNEASIGYKHWTLTSPFGTSLTREYAQLKIHVESNPQLEYINRQGNPDPLGWNLDDPLEGRRIEYWSLKGEKQTETEDTVIYEYELSKDSFLITPSEFWVGFYVVPSQDSAGTGSGWREAEWHDITCWFRLDFHTWDNAYYDVWLDDPQADVFTTEYDGTITSQEKLVPPDSYRGGFPIAGWVQGWEKAGWTDRGEKQSPVWYDVRGTETESYTKDEIAQLYEILMAKVEFTPGLVGQFLSLFDAPDPIFNWESPDASPSNTNFENQKLTDSIKAPDTSMQKVMYFPINIENFGTYAQDQGLWGLQGWKVYYPSAYFRIRMIYGVYGTFKYLWTEEVTKTFIDPETGETTGGLDYPEEIERHGTTVIDVAGPLAGWGGVLDWFASPFNQLWLFFVLMIAVILIVTVANPGLWSGAMQTYNKVRGRKR